jgi:hypothetical protein
MRPYVFLLPGPPTPTRSLCPCEILITIAYLPPMYYLQVQIQSSSSPRVLVPRKIFKEYLSRPQELPLLGFFVNLALT